MKKQKTLRGRARRLGFALVKRRLAPAGCDSFMLLHRETKAVALGLRCEATSDEVERFLNNLEASPLR